VRFVPLNERVFDNAAIMNAWDDQWATAN
jgi:hypothetical protein